MADRDYQEATKLRDQYMMDVDETKLDTAIAKYTEALTRHKDSAAIFHGRGTAYQLKGDFEGASSDFLNAISIEPANSLYRLELQGLRSSRGGTLMLEAAHKMKQGDVRDAYDAALELFNSDTDLVERATERDFLKRLYEVDLSTLNQEPSQFQGDFLPHSRGSDFGKNEPKAPFMSQ